ncbi:DUF7139 domain-containing protein [Halococcoides cellulosivorans]|uniref:Permease n=1 Tax=Halococcoides cellulosivorans TaxID=1679096 RepID=A0A2R4WYD9_9EURY|nr:permease [Halococcoides cellulosivorans]AWB26548.1 permease [Halococcoides cellulosivorans]
MATDAEDLPENALIEYYRRFFGEPDEYVDVYAGFGLFFAGIAFGAIALVAFLVSTTAQPYEGLYYPARRAGFSVGLVGVPMILLGVIVLLPVERKAIVGGAVGTVFTLIATAWFYTAYPYNFNVAGTGQADYSGQIVLIYAVGLAVLLAATATALIAYLIARQKPGPADIQAPDEDDEQDEESYSDEQIRDDIDTAMEGVELTWGGVEKHEGTALKLNTDFGDADLSGMQVEATKTTSDRGVDDQVAGLSSMKAGEAKTATSESTVDDQTAALNDLRDRKRAGEAGEPSQTVGRLSDVTDRAERIGPIGAIADRVRSLFGRGS